MLMSVHIIVTLMGDLQICVKVPFLISCIRKIDKLPKVLVVLYEQMVFTTIIYVI